MQHLDIRIAPKHVVEVESLIRSAICSHLEKLGLGITTKQIEFLCAPWVHFFTHSAMHRLELHGASELPADPSHSYRATQRVPGDTSSFVEYLRTPSYRKYVDATLIGQSEEFDGRTAIYQFQENLPPYADTIAFISCLPRRFRYLLQIYSLGKIRHMDNTPASVELDTDWDSRQSMSDEVCKSLQKNSVPAATWLSARVKELFPKSLLENLPGNFRQKISLPARKALFSGDGWQVIDDWKIYALAQKVRHQTQWIGSPNAVGHGSLAVFWQREFEISHLDTYLTWGWSRASASHAKVVPFFCPNFAGQRASGPARTKPAHGVLISSAARPQHLLEYPYTPDRFERYLNSQLSLANDVQRMTGGQVSIRTRPRDLGWDLQQMVMFLGNPNVTLEFQKGKFADRLKKSWLHICDNCSTTIVESLWANHPTMILITDDYFQIAPAAQEEFTLLQSAGIFHSSKESLVAQLSQVNVKLESWWSSPKTQNAIQSFLSRQGHGGSRLGVWKRALLTQARDSF